MNASSGVHSRGIFSRMVDKREREREEAEDKQRIAFLSVASGRLALICQGERSLSGRVHCGTVESDLLAGLPGLVCEKRRSG